MDLKNLKELSGKLDRNKKGLDFIVQVLQDEDDPKTFFLKLANIEDRYKKAVRELCNQLLSEAKAYIIQEFYLEVLDEDEELEHLRFKKTLDKELLYLFNILVTDGADRFLKEVAFLSTKYKQLYELANVKLNENGELVTRRGEKIA